MPVKVKRVGKNTPAVESRINGSDQWVKIAVAVVGVAVAFAALRSGFGGGGDAAHASKKTPVVATAPTAPDLSWAAPPLSVFEQRVMQGLRRSATPGATVKRWARQHKFQRVSPAVAEILQDQALRDEVFAGIRAPGLTEEKALHSAFRDLALIAFTQEAMQSGLGAQLEWFLWNAFARVTDDKVNG
jgi:hypothetical protein